jgi:hypothetical protein
MRGGGMSIRRLHVLEEGHCKIVRIFYITPKPYPPASLLLPSKKKFLAPPVTLPRYRYTLTLQKAFFINNFEPKFEIEFLRNIEGVPSYLVLCLMESGEAEIEAGVLPPAAALQVLTRGPQHRLVHGKEPAGII